VDEEKMSIKTRLAAICLFFVAVILCLAFVGVRGSQSLAHSVDEVSTHQLPAVRNMTLADMMHDGLRAVVYRALYVANNPSATKEDRAEVAEELKEFTTNITTYKENLRALNLNPETDKMLEEAGPVIEKYKEASTTVVGLALSDRKSEAYAQLPEFNAVFLDVGERFGAIGEKIEADAGRVRDAGKDTPGLVLMISFVSIFVGIVLSLYVIISTSRRLETAYAGIASVAEDIADSSQGLSAASQQLASSSQEQSSSVVETSSSLEEISGMVGAALKGAERSVDLSQRVSDLVKSGTESMSNLQSAVLQIAEANHRVEKLAKLIEEIGEKTDLIDEIVFQTRLLSFNASVEAERAGEHGRGFAVVAQEVGNLAQMSGKSANAIGDIVKNSIKEANEVVNLNRDKVELGVELCKKSFEQFLNIEKASKEISENSDQILRSSEEQNGGVQQINQAIQLISKSSQENSSLAEEVRTSATDINGQGGRLNEVLLTLAQLANGGSGKNSKAAEGNDVSTKGRSSAGDAKRGEQAQSAKSENRKVAQLHRPKRANGKVSAEANGALALKDQEDPWEAL
jgi:methyl-accepting chemotaxis protein